MKHYCAELPELKKELKLRVVLENKPILLTYYKNKVYAMADKCPHLGTSLLLGTFENGVVTCKSHKAKIDVLTGDILEKAQLLFLKMPTKKAVIYPTFVDKNKIYIEF